MKIYLYLCGAIFVSACATGAPVTSTNDTVGLSYSLPKTLLEASISRDNECNITFSIVDGVTIADPQATFVLQANHSLFRSDKFELKTTSEGFLTTVKNDSSGQSAEIIRDVAKFSSGLLMSFDLEAQDQGCQEIQTRLQFDPALEEDRARVADFFGQDYTVEYEFPYLEGDYILQQQSFHEMNGAAYRRKMPIRVSLSCNNKAADSCPEFSNIHMLPQFGRVHVVPLYANGLTQSTGNVKFVNGYPTEYTLNRPSEALSLASLPLTVLTAILEGPKDLLTLRSENKSAIFEQENELRRLKLEEKILQQCLDAAGEIAQAQLACLVSD